MANRIQEREQTRAANVPLGLQPLSQTVFQLDRAIKYPTEIGICLFSTMDSIIIHTEQDLI